MGTYIEFKTKRICLRKDTPEQVISFIQNCISDNAYIAHDEVVSTKDPIFDHSFFKQDRWGRVFDTITFRDLHDGYTPTSLKKIGKYWFLFIWTDIKYGVEEVIEFGNWIAPFVAGHKPKEYIGWWRSEDYNPQVNLYIERPKPQPIARYISEVLYPKSGLPF